MELAARWHGRLMCLALAHAGHTRSRVSVCGVANVAHPESARRRRPYYVRCWALAGRSTDGDDDYKWGLPRPSGASLVGGKN